jgi:hypothetical protein
MSRPNIQVGRPKTRNREAFMLAIWRAIQEEIHSRGAPSVREACKRLFDKRAHSRINFVDADGTSIDVIEGFAGAETLRQRYQTAERCRHDAERYPMLHARAEQLSKSLPGTFGKLKAALAEERHLKNTGHWPF